MSDLKFTKKAMREEQSKLNQLETYLPTLQLKKKLLQFEVSNSYLAIEKIFKEIQVVGNDVDNLSMLFAGEESFIRRHTHIKHTEKSYENIAGVEIPHFIGVEFSENNYSLLDTPIWMDGVLEKLRGLLTLKQRMNVEEEKKNALIKELNEVSIRVNLFEKILIPRTVKNIKKIRVFLSDQELAAVAQAKVAKTKILKKSKR